MRPLHTKFSLYGFYPFQPTSAIHSILLLLLYINVLVSCIHDDQCLVTTPAGAFRGLVGASILYPESVHCQFLGIKYAEALGSRRFGKPKPVEFLGPGVRDASSYSNMCPPIRTEHTNEPTGEDCLTLNVFTPKIYSRTEEPLRAVLVFIHGGAFKDGTSRLYRPDNLVPRDVLLVTMNYRLGPLGFLNLNISRCPGNMGLWDQSVALKWIRTNIESFGGDPNRITLSGQSAGATSTYLHILSPVSQDLFQRAIIQSPVTLTKCVKNDTVSKSIAFAKFVGCPSNPNNREEILRCLQDKSVDDLTQASGEYMNLLDQTNDMFRYDDPPFWPSEDAFQERPFLPSTSLEELGKKAPNIDIIMGQLSADGAAYFGGFDRWDVVAKLQRTLHIYLSKEPLFAKDERVLQAVVGKVKQYYFDESKNDNALNGAQKLLMDLTFNNWYTETIPFLNASYMNGKIRIYQFRVDDFQGMKKLFFAEDYYLVEGAAHGEENDYLYSFLDFRFASSTITENQFRVVQEMTMLWSNFAKFGHPTNVSGDNQFEWEPLLPFPAEPNFLLLGNKTTIFIKGKKIEQERRDFWTGLQNFAREYYNYLSNMRLHFKENGQF